MTNVFDLAQNDTVLKKAASTGGGEWAGACPFCGGKDRFHVQPYNKEGGRWYCRVCGESKWHDVFDYVMRRNNCGFAEAKRILAVENPNWQPITRKAPPVQAQQHQTEFDAEIWQVRAAEYIQYCEDCMIERGGDETASWLLKRGITDKVIVSARLGYNPKDIQDEPERWGYPASHARVFLSHGLIIPNIDSAGIHAIKVRRGEPGKKYLLVPGSKIWLYGAWTCTGADTAFLFESELDALLGYSSGYGFGYLALPAGQHINGQYNYILSDVGDIVVMPDNDAVGMAHAEAMAKMPAFHVGPITPTGKDLSEYYQSNPTAAALVDYLYTSAAYDGKI